MHYTVTRVFPVLIFLLFLSAAVESTGQAKAEAQSRAEAAKIEGEAAVEQARLKSQASKIEAVSYREDREIESEGILLPIL